MERKFAFILMGEHYDPQVHKVDFKTAGQISSIRTVCNFDQALALMDTLRQDGYGAVEVCGAFGPDRAQKLIERSNGEIAVGFVTHFPEQDTLFDAFFSHHD